tara:strand:- start:1687 stop:2313 length:627 start_codon:yes stop_codon:yes gene_type:complete
MGQINHPMKLKETLESFGIKNFVETGTGDGSSMNKVIDTEVLDKQYGIELDTELFRNLMKQYDGNENVIIFNGYSEDCMDAVLEELSEDPTLFWLDAHFPGADYGPAGYGDEEDLNKRLPMEAELKIMKEKRDLSKDLIFMDDLRIYVDRDFEAGNWPERSKFGANGYDFVEELIGDTHILVEHLADQGYLLAFPIDTEEESIRELVR